MAVLTKASVLSVLVAVMAAGPAFAQKQSLADRVARLEAQSSSQNSTAGQANVELLNRVTQMQAEVQALRNQVEQLQNENAQLKQRSQDQYIDTDSRLQRIEGGASPAPAAGAAPVAPARNGAAAPARNGAAAPARNGAALPPPVTAPETDSAGAAPRQFSPGDEQAAYSAAFNLLKAGNYVESARGFQAYLNDFPQGSLAPNAWYWLGESYYVTQNYPVALRAFESLLSQFPDSAKAPDALLKRGFCQIELGEVGPGQQTLNRVMNDFPGTEAARVANSRLRSLSVESR